MRELKCFTQLKAVEGDFSSTLTCIEVGHGTVLKGLLKKIDFEYFQVFGTNSLDEIKVIETVMKSV